MPSNDYNKADSNPYHTQHTSPSAELGYGRKRVLGIVLVIIGLVWLVNSMLPMIFDNLFGKHQSASFDQRYSVQHVVVDSINARVILRGSKEAQLRVRFEQGSGEDGAVQVVQDGDSLHLSHQIKPCFFCDDDLVYELDIPDNIQVTINSVSGDIEAHDLHASLNLTSQSGEIEIHKLQGSLLASSSSGDIQVEDADLDIAKLETTSGAIMLAGRSAELIAKSVSGEIQITNTIASLLELSTASGDVTVDGQPDRASDITSVSGDIDIKLNPQSNVALNISTVSGDLRSDIELQDLLQSPQTLSGSTGDGSIPLTVHTTSGDISLR